MTRKVHKDRKLGRRGHSRNPGIKIFIFCEGEKTEPAYINDFKNHCKNYHVEITIARGQGVPVSVVRAAAEKKKELKQKADRSSDSFEEKYEVWAMFDIDDHKQIPNAKDQAEGNKIKVCISNPCFEIWGLLHFRDQTANIRRNKLQSELSKVMQGYDHNSKAIFNFKMMNRYYEQAKERAKELKVKHLKDGTKPPHDNPSTDAYKLLDIIKGKKL